MCDSIDTEVCWACDGEGAGESGRQCRRCMGTGEVRADFDDNDDGLDCFEAPEPREWDGEGEP